MLVAARRAVYTARSSSASCLLHRQWLGVAHVARENFSSVSSATISQDGSISYLRNPRNGAEVYLVGTAHVSNKSAEQVREVNHVHLNATL